MQKNDFKGQDLSTLFKGKDLRGSGDKFKNQDLTGADFSDCDLRGVDFSFANLTDAKFCNARMGKKTIVQILITLLQISIGVVAGFINVLSIVFLLLGIQEMLDKLGLAKNYQLVEIALPSIFLISFLTLLAIQRHRINYLLWLLSIMVASTVIIAGFTGVPLFICSGVGMLTALVIIITIALAIIGVGVLAISGIVSVIIATLLSIVVSQNVASGSGVIMDGYGFITITSIIFNFLGIYLSYKAINKQESQLFFLRQLVITFRCLGGTKFIYANLNKTNFCEADLKYTRFSYAKNFNQSHWQHAKNHHLAQTRHTHTFRTPQSPRFSH